MLLGNWDYDNNFPPFFVLENDTMVKNKPKIIEGVESYIPWDEEILSRFFTDYNIVPQWINCNGRCCTQHFTDTLEL